MEINHNCPDCGENLSLDMDSAGITSCSNCGAQLELGDDAAANKTVRRVKSFGPRDYTDELLEKLNDLERNSLEESAIASGQGAYIASEFMSLRALESVSRRITNEGTWDNAIDRIEEQHGELSGYIGMLRDRRNEVAHPDAVESSEHLAERTFEQVKHTLDYLEDHITD